MISVVIPNWNGIVHLPPCLEALQAQTHADYEVLLVDNASEDGSQELIAREYPDVELVVLETNEGFTGACNAGMRVAKGEIVVLLNNDTEVVPDWLAQIEAAFERHPEAGMVASKMLLYDRRNTLHAAGDEYRVDGTPANRGVWQTDSGQYSEGYVFSACGGTAAYRRAMLEQIGLLDEDFFFSCEDVDLGWRAQLQGWRVVYAPQAVVYHHLAATGAGTTASFHNGRNFIYVLVMDVPGSIWRKHWFKILRAQLRIAGEALRAWRGPAARARLRGQFAGILALPRLLRKRRKTQAQRTVSDDYIESVLTV